MITMISTGNTPQPPPSGLPGHHEHQERQGHQIREHLSRRNGKPFSLADLQTTSLCILLRNRDAGPIHYHEFRETHPHARLWTQPYLPGYSKSHERAVLRFSFGPSSHGAAGTYFLTKQDGMWRVTWRSFAFYL
jgi:hypothetical protein